MGDNNQSTTTRYTPDDNQQPGPSRHHPNNNQQSGPSRHHPNNNQQSGPIRHHPNHNQQPGPSRHHPNNNQQPGPSRHHPNHNPQAELGRYTPDDNQQPGPSHLINQHHRGVKRPRDPQHPTTPPRRVRYSGSLAKIEYLRTKHCLECDVRFQTISTFQNHIINLHAEWYDEDIEDGEQVEEEEEEVEDDNQQGGGTNFNFILDREAFNGMFRIYKCNLNTVEVRSLKGMFNLLYSSIEELLSPLFTNFKPFKIQFSISCEFSRVNMPNDTRDFHSFLFPCHNRHQIVSIIKLVRSQLSERIESYTQNGSGWIFEKITECTLSIMEYEPFSGGAGNINLPPLLQHKSHAVYNVPADDNLCFKRAVQAHFIKNHLHANVKRDLERKLVYTRVDTPEIEIDWTGITFPFELRHVKKFERQNPSISICIIGYSEEGQEPVEMTLSGETYTVRIARLQKALRDRCFPLHVGSEDKEHCIDVLLVMGVDDTNHLCYITGLQTFLYNGNTFNKICRYCLHSFGIAYDEHIRLCAALGNQKTNFPSDQYLYFNKYTRTQKVPFVIFADFESFLKMIERSMGVEYAESIRQSYADNVATRRLKEHVPCGYSWLSVMYDGTIHDGKTYRTSSNNEDVGLTFLNEIINYNEHVQHIISGWEQQAPYTMIMTRLQRDIWNDPVRRRAEGCCLCHGPFLDSDVIVRHHLHSPPFTYIGPAHQTPCNTHAKAPRELVVAFHNFTGYDGKYILKAAIKIANSKIEVIPNSSEKFMGITINKTIKFIDTLRFFMGAGLASLVKGMDITRDFDITRQRLQRLASDRFGNLTDAQLNMILQKGIYPYNYIDCVEKFGETQLPPIEEFYNDLKDSDLPETDYEHAQNVWTALGIQNLGEWHDLYVTVDTCLLADAFFSLRNTIYNKYELDAANYLSLPMLSWDCALKYTRVKLEYIRDPEMHTWLESAIRGGLVSVGSVRAAKANNQYLPDYNPNLDLSYIIYLDANNLYGYALFQKLPVGGFRWWTSVEKQMCRNNINEFVNSMSDDGDLGAFFEVDIHIPSEIHDKLNDYPPCPTKRCVDINDISYMQHTMGVDLDLNLVNVSKTPRLIADLHDKTRYICHYRALKCWISLGVVVTSVHKVLFFSQASWIAPYVMANTQMRTIAISKLVIKFWKDLNNTAFGKSIEQKRNRQNIIVLRNMEQAMKYAKKATVDSFIIINDQCVLIILKKLSVTLDTPIAVGCSVLELSKTLMFNFHYNYMVETYSSENLKLLYTDTDSLVYWVKTNNIYQDCKDNQSDKFDMSDYDPTDLVLGGFYSDVNKKKVGYFKDELPNGVISEVVVNKPKMYCVRYVENRPKPIPCSLYNVKKKAKGVPTHFVNNNITYEDYVTTLMDPIQTHCKTRSIRSYRHALYTIESVKRAINGFDVKRFCHDGINTLAYGHKDIPLFNL